MPTLRLRLSLTDLEDEIWRELLVPDSLTLPELHRVIQAAMGWEDAHLHGFARGTDYWQAIRRWVPDPGDDPRAVPEERIPATFLLTEPGDVITYLYDYGDDWDHRLRLLERVPNGAPASVTAPTVVAGAGACPPEDSGGAAGYLAILTAVREHADLGEVDEWVRHAVGHFYGTLDGERVRNAVDAFDVAEADARLRRQLTALPALRPDLRELVAAGGRGPGSLHERVQLAAGRLVPDGATPVPLDAADCAQLTWALRWFLEHVGESGLALTKAGYLRPADVVAMVEALDLAREEPPGSLNREEFTLTVADFRAASRQLGLLRALKGRLVRTKAGDALAHDPVGLTRHVRSRLPLGADEFSRTAGMLALVDLAAEAPDERGTRGSGRGRADETDRIATQLELLGWHNTGGGPLDGQQVHDGIRPTVTVLTRCGVLEWERFRFSWVPTPLGRRFLAAELGMAPGPV